MPAEGGSGEIEAAEICSMLPGSGWFAGAGLWDGHYRVSNHDPKGCRGEAMMLMLFGWKDIMGGFQAPCKHGICLA